MSGAWQLPVGDGSPPCNETPPEQRRPGRPPHPAALCAAPASAARRRLRPADPYGPPTSAVRRRLRLAGTYDPQPLRLAVPAAGPLLCFTPRTTARRSPLRPLKQSKGRAPGPWWRVAGRGPEHESRCT
ncbi:hypothetical protein MILUP08_45976 [Micromonospora lupini str. Lupac 08]|uniref:Uncharacterized protein n=1 Tax=Micromonospora lupini str. Lupac 08 TaxID=1150864 RepID=I0LB85_9ACTN|nr:hypothetical protein MILUP08_45976 [Micromonospora lupini str. Lupac 08]